MKTRLTEDQLREWHNRCYCNRNYIEEHPEEVLGCYSCCKQYRFCDIPTDKIAWCDEMKGTNHVVDRSLLCPHCGIDSVGYGSDVLPFLKEMQMFFSPQNIMGTPGL